MQFDIQTLAFIQCLIFITQVIVLFVQYRINRTYRGIGWWVVSSILMALGVILMPFVAVKSLVIFARFANPLIILGQIFVYIGVNQFLEKKVNKWIPISIYSIFVSLYSYFMYVNKNISGRTVVVNTTLAVILLMTSQKLFLKKGRLISGSANFTASIFLVYGCLLAIRAIYTLILPPIQSYSDQAAILQVAFIVPIIASTLWTFGFIIMLNQRLNIENFVEKEKMQQIFNTSPDDITITDLEGRILMVSSASKKMFGYESNFEEFVGMRLIDFIIPEDAERAQSNLRQMFTGDYQRPNEYHAVRKDQSIFNIEVNSGIISDTKGKPTKMVFVIRDITERKLAEQKIQQLVQQLELERNTAQYNSITDSLTGLSNRRYFDEALTKEFYKLKKSGLIISLIMLDVDYFKKYNDNYGHLAGDDCLIQIGNMFKRIVRQGYDIVARYGGEEFVIILPSTDEKVVKALAECIQASMEELAIPHAASNIAKYVTLSMGIISVCTTHLNTPEQVVTLADVALYRAKDRGRNRIEVEIFKDF